MRYRRAIVPGATYFFTVNLQNRKSNLLIKKIDVLRYVFKKVQQKHPFYIDAIVILPDHWHMVMTLPTDDCNYALRLSQIKSTFSRQIEPNELMSNSRQKKRERGIWQRRYWEHLIKDPTDYEHHINYIHYNPVKHKYITKPSDWPYSSIHRFIHEGILNSAWGDSERFDHCGFGEST